jgi:hypothetical protein
MRPRPPQCAHEEQMPSQQERQARPQVNRSLVAIAAAL